MTIKRWLLCLVVSIVTLSPVESATRTVRSRQDRGSSSLRATIARARSGDTILLRFRGALELTGELVLDKNLTLRGVPAGRAILSGAGRTRILRVTEGTTTTLEGLLLEQGSVPDYQEGAGGAILNEGTLTVRDCTLADNLSGYQGGAIFNAGSLRLERTQVFRNVADFGGGIYSVGEFQMSHSMVSGNRALSAAGGVASLGELTVDTCLISENGADSVGGMETQGTAVIRNTAIVANGTISVVGAIANSGELWISNSTLSGNRSDGIGAIANSGQLTLVNCTVLYNYGTGEIGGIASIGTLTLGNTIVAANRIQPGGEDPILDISGEITSLGHNLIGDSTGATGFTESDLLDLDPRLGPLQDNGGPTPTHVPLALSPALDAGDNALVDASLTTDQRGEGFPRIAEGTGDGSPVVDIGAVEFQGADVTLVKTAVGRARFGTRVTYTLTVRNLGLETAEQVELRDELPGGAAFLDATTTQGTLSTPPVGVNGTVRANLGLLAPGATARVRITIRVSTRPPLSNSAGVDTTSFDVRPDNNQDTVVLRR